MWLSLFLWRLNRSFLWGVGGGTPLTARGFYDGETVKCALLSCTDEQSTNTIYIAIRANIMINNVTDAKEKRGEERR